jgi:crossover junction endodeoxyribonuclease RuvC
MAQPKPVRILGLDLSLSSPGAGVVDIKDGKAEVIAHSHVAPSSKLDYAVRGRIIESWLRLFIQDNYRKPGRKKLEPYDYILREKYAGKFGHHSIYTAHSAADRALHDFELYDTEKHIAQQSVKKLVVGKGRAEKEEVEDAVRKLTNYDGEFAVNDESDAVAVALSCAIQHDLIDTKREDD